MADRVSRRGKRKINRAISRHICVYIISTLKHLSNHMHLITNGYRMLFKDQLDRSKATCSFKQLYENVPWRSTLNDPVIIYFFVNHSRERFDCTIHQAFTVELVSHNNRILLHAENCFEGVDPLPWTALIL